MAPERPSIGSWNDLMSRSRRSGSVGESMHAESDTRRRPRSSSLARPHSTANDFASRPPARPRGREVERPSSSGVDYIVTGRTHSNSPVRRPTMPRTMTHHVDQRDSAGFANHIAAVTGSPSPLRTVRTLRSSDSMPELNRGASADRNSYTTDQHQPHRMDSSKRPATHLRTGSRLAESMSMDDLDKAQTKPSPEMPSSKASIQARMRAASWHGKPPPVEPSPFQTVPPLPVASIRKSGSDWNRRPDLIKHTRARKPGPNELFDKLPHEVLAMIMLHLRQSHLERSSSCATCWQRDCCSIALSNRKWLKASRDAMYEDIQLVGPDGAQQRKKYKCVYSTRLVLLRRTLRYDTKLAALLRFLKVPALPDDAPIETVEYHDIVASVVMACPNLERLDGFYPTYNHSESRLFNALTSRMKLKEMTWIIDAARSEPEMVQGHKTKSSKSSSRNRHSRHQSSSSAISTRSHRYLSASLANKFVRHHMGWPELTHLTIHCLPGAQLNTPNGLLNIIQTYLISLQSLHLSQVPPNAFNDSTLLAFPKPLKNLTLSHCVGVTTAGLSTLATTPSAQHLETLTLVHQNLDSLPTVVRLLANLSSLSKFCLVQSVAPTMPDDELIWLMPYLGSRSLRFLHWDVFDSAFKDRNGVMPGTKTDDILANSIAANGFPNLRFLRVPCDPDGKFQALCRPRERVDLPGDRYRNGITKQASTGALRALAKDPISSNANINTTIIKPYASSGTLGPYSSSAISLLLPSSEASFDGRPSSSLSNTSDARTASMLEAGSDTHKARLRAQARLEAARGFPLFEANITDEDGMLVESTGLAGYLGDIKSDIIYTLAPDPGASDEHGGLVGILDLLSDNGEDLFGKGDAASRSGAGYGTGCVGSEYAKTKALEEEAAVTDATAKSKSKSKITKSNREKAPSNGDVTDHEGAKIREGCTGRWNSYNENFAMGDRWVHAERGRWKGPVKLS